MRQFGQPLATKEFHSKKILAKGTGSKSSITGLTQIEAAAMNTLDRDRGSLDTIRKDLTRMRRDAGKVIVFNKLGETRNILGICIHSVPMGFYFRPGAIGHVQNFVNTSAVGETVEAMKEINRAAAQVEDSAGGIDASSPKGIVSDETLDRFFALAGLFSPPFASVSKHISGLDHN